MGDVATWAGVAGALGLGLFNLWKGRRRPDVVIESIEDRWVTLRNVGDATALGVTLDVNPSEMLEVPPGRGVLTPGASTVAAIADPRRVGTLSTAASITLTVSWTNQKGRAKGERSEDTPVSKFLLDESPAAAAPRRRAPTSAVDLSRLVDERVDDRIGRALRGY